MHPVAFKKALIEAYLAGADSMYCGCYNRQTRVDAKEWFDNEYGQQQSEDCDCCEENDNE
jgi:hypothetical protein